METPGSRLSGVGAADSRGGMHCPCRGPIKPAMSDSSANGPDWADETEQRLLDAALPMVGELGWSDRLVWAAAKAVGLTRPEAELLVPHGPSDLAALLARRHDARAMQSLAGVDPKTLKI